MINQNIHTQNLQSTGLVFEENNFKETKINLEALVSKVTTIDPKQLKSYLGVFYFGVVSLLSITLFL